MTTPNLEKPNSPVNFPTSPAGESGSEFNREQAHIQAGEKEITETDKVTAIDESTETKPAVDGGVFISKELQKKNAALRQQPDSQLAPLPKELQARLIEDIANKNHKVKFDAFDLTKISQGDTPDNFSEQLTSELEH